MGSSAHGQLANALHRGSRPTGSVKVLQPFINVLNCHVDVGACVVALTMLQSWCRGHDDPGPLPGVSVLISRHTLPRNFASTLSPCSGPVEMHVGDRAAGPRTYTYGTNVGVKFPLSSFIINSHRRCSEAGPSTRRAPPRAAAAARNCTSLPQTAVPSTRAHMTKQIARYKHIKFITNMMGFVFRASM